jgi:hypothetical protein
MGIFGIVLGAVIMLALVIWALNFKSGKYKTEIETTFTDVYAKVNNLEKKVIADLEDRIKNLEKYSINKKAD